MNAIEGWVDVMVSASVEPIFRRMFKCQEQIEDVQLLLDQNELERNSTSGAFFDTFPTNGQVLVWLNEQIAAHPSIATRIVLGKSFSGTDIVGLHLGSSSSQKPVIFIHCTIHAREWITTTTCCWIIDNLLNTDPDGARLLNSFEWIIVPVFNVDGYNYAHTTDRLWRKNRQTNSGSSCIGTDLNRNYGYGFGGEGSSPNPCSETFHGGRAFSSPEVNSERNFLQTYVDEGRLIAFVDIHSYGGMWMSPWGYTTALPPDYAAMDASMRAVAPAIRAINGRTYAIGTSARVIYVAAGGSDDNCYGEGGVVQSYTIEAYGTSFTPPVSYIPQIGRELWAGVKQLATILE